MAGMSDEAIKHVRIYTDGACAGNPGPGGWAALLLFGGVEKEISGGEAHTTNNRMEMMAAIEGLNALKQPCSVDLFTDSQYVHKGITSWLAGWKRKGWRSASGEPVKNVELWQALEAAAARHRVKWHWVRGHADDALNNRVDGMAVAAMKPFRRTPATPAPAESDGRSAARSGRRRRWGGRA
jgi:ribonuclease HI